MLKTFRNSLVICALVLIFTPANSWAETPPYEWLKAKKQNPHFHYQFREQHNHPYQWANSEEGLDLGMIDVSRMIKNAFDLGLVKKISIAGRVGTVEITPLFRSLSFRDQRLFAHSFDSFYKQKKQGDYDFYVMRTQDGQNWASYSTYGLHIY